MPSSTDGHRWEKHRVKVKARGASSAGIDKQEAIGNGNPHASRDGYEAEWQDCPGCSTCLPTGGYIFRRGNWRPTTSHEYVFMLTKSASYYSDKLAVAEQAVYPEGEVREGGDGHKSLLSGSRTTAGLHDKTWVGTGYRNRRSVWSTPERLWRLRTDISGGDRAYVLRELAVSEISGSSYDNESGQSG